MTPETISEIRKILAERMEFAPTRWERIKSAVGIGTKK